MISLQQSGLNQDTQEGKLPRYLSLSFPLKPVKLSSSSGAMHMKLLFPSPPFPSGHAQQAESIRANDFEGLSSEREVTI